MDVWVIKYWTFLSTGQSEFISRVVKSQEEANAFVAKQDPYNKVHYIIDGPHWLELE